MKINKKYSSFLFALLMTFALDTTMTFTMTMINTGWTERFIYRFLTGWVIGFIVAFPTSILIIPIARKIVAKLVE